MKLENRLQQILLTGLALADVTSAQGFGMGASGPTSRVSLIESKEEMFNHPIRLNKCVL